MWWANRDTKKVPFSCRNSAGKRDEEDNFSVVPLFLGARSAPALSHLCNNVLLYNGRIPSMLTLLMIAVLHCGSGRRYPAFLRLSHTNRQLSATNELHLFSRQRLFLNTDSKSNSAVFSLFYRIFPDLSSVFLIFPHFFLSGRIFSGNRGKPYTFFVQTVKIRTECLILS